VLEIHGVEADYDAETVSFDDARDLLKRVGVSCVLYTTKSNTPQKPRWRVLCPTSGPITAEDRTRLLNLLNGALGGILAPESWTLSQSYFFGRLTKPDEEWRCEVLAGDPIDVCAFAGVTPIPKRDRRAADDNGADVGFNIGSKAADLSEMIAAARTGRSGMNMARMALMGRLVRDGVAMELVDIVIDSLHVDSYVHGNGDVERYTSKRRTTNAGGCGGGPTRRSERKPEPTPTRPTRRLRSPSGRSPSRCQKDCRPSCRSSPNCCPRRSNRGSRTSPSECSALPTSRRRPR
jgi:hypothetical protein